MPLSRLRIISSLLVSAIGAALRHLFRTGYYPKEWPLKMSLITGVTKGLFGLMTSTTIEESQEMTGKDNNPAATKDAWLVEVPIPKSEENVKYVMAVLNTAFATLGPDVEGLEVNADDVSNDLTAEWTAVKSDASLKGSLFIAFGLKGEKPWTSYRCWGGSKHSQMMTIKVMRSK